LGGTKVVNRFRNPSIDQKNM